MTIDQLKTFIALAEATNMLLVAQQMSVTQAALTQRIRTLEAELGANLFSLSSRTKGRGRKLILTNAGLTFLPYVQTALETLQTGINNSRATAQDPTSSNGE